MISPFYSIEDAIEILKELLERYDAVVKDPEYNKKIERKYYYSTPSNQKRCNLTGECTPIV